MSPYLNISVRLYSGEVQYARLLGSPIDSLYVQPWISENLSTLVVTLNGLIGQTFQGISSAYSVEKFEGFPMYVVRTLFTTEK